MIDRSTSNVSEAFDMLLEEIISEIRSLDQVGSTAFAQGDHATAHRVLQRVGDLQALQQEVSKLRDKWRVMRPPVELTTMSIIPPEPVSLPTKAPSTRLVQFDGYTERLVQHNPDLRELLLHIYNQVKSLCPDATCYGTPKSKWINFRCERNFLVLNPLKDHFDGGIAIGADYKHPRLDLRRSRGGAAGWNGWTEEYQGLRLRRVSDLDDEFRRLLRIAATKYGGCQIINRRST